MPRRLAVARHAQGTDALGWILLGFLLGAGVSIAVLINSRFGPRNESAPVEVAATAPEPILPAHPASSPQPTLPAALPAAPPPAADAAPAEQTEQLSPVNGMAGPRPAPPPSEDPQVAEDAAAAGMTSRPGTAASID